MFFFFFENRLYVMLVNSDLKQINYNVLRSIIFYNSFYRGKANMMYIGYMKYCDSTYALQNKR